MNSSIGIVVQKVDGGARTQREHLEWVQKECFDLSHELKIARQNDNVKLEFH